jgi:competence protein ComEC
MSSVFCISFFFRRKSNPFNILSLAAMLLLLIRPTYLFEADWQLSFATVLGILLFARPVEDFIYEKLTVLFEDPLTGKMRSYFRIVSKFVPLVIAVFSVSFAAWLASSGILLYHFYTIQPLTSIWTVAASPFIAVISFAGYLKLLVGLVLPTAASILDIIIKPLSSWLIELVKHIAQIDVSQVLIGHLSVWLVVFYYCTILFIAFIHFKHTFTKKVISTGMILVIIFFLGITKWQRTHRDNLTMTCLDVGHGQAILAQLPGNANILFDAGSLYKSDVCRRIVAPFLDYIGISRIDSIILSHNDVDHINGIPGIAECCKVKNIYANEAFFDTTDQWGAAEFLNEQLLKKRHKILHLDESLNLAGDAKIKILWPNKKATYYEQLSDNDKSLVSLIEFAGKKILLCSDIEKFAQVELLSLYPGLKADVVVVPHHGSSKTTEQYFLKNLDAGILICSCGRSDYKNSRTIKPQSNAKWLCTAEHGAVIVCIDKDGMIR